MGMVIGLGGGTRRGEGVVMNDPWAESNRRPSSWLLQHADVLPREGRALDVACGRGRHALWLAERGLTTLAVDRDVDAVRGLNDVARERGLPLRAEVRDLEDGSNPFAGSTYDVIIVVH